MAPELVVRDLRASDLTAYKAMRDEMLALHPDAFTSDAATELAKPAADHLARLRDPRGDPVRFTLGAWWSDRLVGALSCERDSRLKVRHIGRLVGMMVRPDARRRGIGRALLAACIEEVRKVRGVELLILSVTSTNVAARSLYESAGFERYGRLAHALKLADTYHDKDFMALPL